MQNLITNLNQISDGRGKLIVFEKDNNLNFELKRTYFIFSESNSDRGFHAHHNTNQLLVCLNGSVTIYFDDGVSKSSYLLDSTDVGVFIPKLVWHHMANPSADCIMTVMADQLYDEHDYIRNYNEFIKLIKDDTPFS